MTLFASIAIDGIAYGMILFIISVGLSISARMMRFVNLAHGAFAMLGGFAAVVLMQRAGWRFEFAVPAAVLLTALVSVPVERYLISRVYRRPELDQALLTIGVAFVAIALVNLWLGASFSSIELPAWLSGPVDLGFRSFPRHRLAVILLGFMVSAALWIFIERSASASGCAPLSIMLALHRRSASTPRGCILQPSPSAPASPHLAALPAPSCCRSKPIIP